MKKTTEVTTHSRGDRVPEVPVRDLLLGREGVKCKRRCPRTKRIEGKGKTEKSEENNMKMTKYREILTPRDPVRVPEPRFYRL